MRIATWNINSVRLRLNWIARLAQESNPDIICLQETKVRDELFPEDDIRAIGYQHIAFAGMKSYNGVAILSRVPLESVHTLNWCGKEDCRHIAATVPGGVELHNFYVPAGGDEADRDKNEKFGHKLDFLDEMTGWFSNNRSAGDKMILVGDLNIAPLETDVWSHKQLLKVVSHTPVEVEKLGQVQDSAQWVDAVRRVIPPAERLYSWWSYRAKDWTAANRGRRLDHIWVTPPLAGAIWGAEVVCDARSWEKPSDHAPVIVEFEEF
ncbi:MAG: Exodeoxyribonuclease III [Alphaproteobacteria bacterium MarineAlpha10_Bin3]|nr:MAG: Exodeoxyribonuclease III [Alphaproteobacteria bacterium MarineAlpha10_Bin3]PPR68513.1 MAG: Exodeoxyribonuclease III [Alphaproteobacteria bacterium MarineAlpha4_Bin1]